jgi:hypothetical protein
VRKLLALMLALVAIGALAGCGNNASSDPYEVVLKTRSAQQGGPVQIDVGASGKSAGTTISLDPGAIRIVIDPDAGKGSFHLSLPAAALGVPQAALAQLGITGSTIDLDALWDGQALYAKSPIFATLLTAFGAQGGITLPSGDLTGWLKLLTKTELDGLSGGATAPPVAVPSGATAGSLKTELNDAGITLTLAGTEQKNGVDSSHIAVAIDLDKLLASPMFGSVTQAQVAQIKEAAQKATLSGDLWIGTSTNKLVEVDLHVVSKENADDKADLTIAFSTPSSPSFEAPASSLEIPTMQIVGQLIQMFGAGLAT